MAKIMNIRGVDERVAREFAAGAAIRGLTQAEFLKKLLELRMEACLAISTREGDPKWAMERIANLHQWLSENEMLDMYA